MNTTETLLKEDQTVEIEPTFTPELTLTELDMVGGGSIIAAYN
jgi:hypothetical protein